MSKTLNIPGYIKSRLYYIIATILWLTFAASLFPAYNNYHVSYLVYACMLLFSALQITTFFVIKRRRFTGELKISRLKRKINYAYYIFIPIYTLRLFITKHDSFAFNVTMGLYVLFITELLIFFLYKYYKPVSIVVNGNQLLVNDKILDKRNLENLAAIELDTMEKQIVLRFTCEPNLEFIIKEYPKTEMRLFIDKIISVPSYMVPVQPLVFTKLQPPAPRPPFFKWLGKSLKDTLLP